MLVGMTIILALLFEYVVGIVAKQVDDDMVASKDGILGVQNHSAYKEACFASEQFC